MADRSAATVFATERLSCGHNHYLAGKRKVEEDIGTVMLVDAGK